MHVGSVLQCVHDDGEKQNVPWLIKTAAYTPIVVFALGTKLVLMVATVEMNVAHAKLWEYIISAAQHRGCLGK